MPVDKSLFYYGRLYYRLFDLPLAQARRVAVELIPAGSTVGPRPRHRRAVLRAPHGQGLPRDGVGPVAAPAAFCHAGGPAALFRGRRLEVERRVVRRLN